MERLLLGLLALLCPLSWFLGTSQTVLPPAIEPPVAITAVAPTTVIVEDSYMGAVFSPPVAETLGLENITGMAMDGYWMPVQNDIAILEENLTSFIEENASLFRRDMPDELPIYTRQYIGFYSNGDPMIYLNAFCQTDFFNWQSDFVFVLDGGDCYFQVIYNTRTETFSNLMINGEA